MENKSLNQLKFIASIFVVLIHTSAFRYVNNTGYVFDFIVDTIARFGVPVFFCISGYFLYSKYQKFGFKYWANYIKKILWLHLWVGFLYLLVTYLDVKLKGGTIPPSFFNLKHQFNNFLYGGFHYHLWYLPSLIFAVTIVFLAFFMKKESLLFYISIILGIAGTFGNTEIYAPISMDVQAFLLKPLRSFGLVLHPVGFSARNGLFFALPYVMLGYYIAKEKIEEKFDWSKKKFFATIISLFLLQIIERSSAVLLLKSLQGSNFFISTLPLIFFIMILCLREPNLFPRLNKISNKSLSIYLWHPMAMLLWMNILRNFTKENSFIYSLLFTPLVIATVIFFPNFKTIKKR